MVGAGTGPLGDTLDVCCQLNATVCSILDTLDMYYMAVIEHLAQVAPLYEQKMGVLFFGFIGIVLNRGCWDQCKTDLLEYVAHRVPSLVGK